MRREMNVLRAVLVVLALMLSPVSRANMNECEERVDLAVTVGLDDLHNTSTAIDDETFLLLCSSTHDFDHERWYFEDVNGEIILARIANNGSWVETTECPQGELLRGKFATEPVVVWCCADRMVKRRRTERKTTKVPHECVRVSIHVARPSPTRSTQEPTLGYGPVSSFNVIPTSSATAPVTTATPFPTDGDVTTSRSWRTVPLLCVVCLYSFLSCVLH